MNDIEKKMKMADLYDFYGPLLTDKQQEILGQYCMEDLSLVEISENLKISRQAVYDTVRKAEKQMEDLEKRLCLLGRHRIRKKGIETVIRCISQLDISSNDQEEMITILTECMD